VRFRHGENTRSEEDKREYERSMLLVGLVVDHKSGRARSSEERRIADGGKDDLHHI
jgi:hypothetical protein